MQRTEKVLELKRQTKAPKGAFFLDAPAVGITLGSRSRTGADSRGVVTIISL